MQVNVEEFRLNGNLSLVCGRGGLDASDLLHMIDKFGSNYKDSDTVFRHGQGLFHATQANRCGSITYGELKKKAQEIRDAHMNDTLSWY